MMINSAEIHALRPIFIHYIKLIYFNKKINNLQ